MSMTLPARHPEPWQTLAASLGGGELDPLQGDVASGSGHDLARHRTIAERSRHKQRVDARAAGDDDADVRGAIRDPDMVRVADFGKPARATMVKPHHATLGKSYQRNPGALEYRILNVLLADAVARHGRRMFRADDEQRTGRE